MPYSYFQLLQGRLNDIAMIALHAACLDFFLLFLLVSDEKNTRTGVAGWDFQWPTT